VHRGLELLGEFHGQQSSASPAELIGNAGARQKIVLQIAVQTAVGTAVHGLHDDRTRFLLYAGLQFNLPGQYAFSRTHPRGSNDVRTRGHAFVT
jgi:hypothetical protein